MASLGTLTLDLVAKIGGYTAGLDKAEREAKKRAAAIQKVFDAAGTAIGASFGAAIAGATAGLVAFDQLIKSAGDFQDIAEKIGGSAEGIASFALAAGTAGTSIETIASASIRLTKGLTDVDDESKAAGAAIAALGLNLEDFKRLAPEDQIGAVSKALAGFEDGAQKTAVAVALFGKSGAELLPFLKALEEQGGRQVILTAEQIRQADEYSDAQAKAVTELKLYAQVASTQALPALNTLIEAFSELAKELIGVDSAGKALADTGFIKEFAEASVRLLAGIVDAGDAVIRTFRSVGLAIYGAAGAAGSAAKGEFASALSYIQSASKDINDIWSRDFLNTRISRSQANQALIASNMEDPEIRRLLGRAGAANSRQQLSFSGGVKAPKSTKAKSEKQEIDESSTALAAYVKALQGTIDKTEELTEVEKANKFLLGLGKAGEIPQVRELVLGLAERADKEKEINELIKDRIAFASAEGDAVNAANEKRFQELDAIYKNTPTAKLEEQRRIVGELTADFTNGLKTQAEYEEAVSTFLDLNADKLEKNKSLADELGLSFTSAFEDAIVGGKGFSEVLKGLEQDILRIVTRKLVTEPLGNALTDAFKSSSGGGAGGFLSGITSSVGGFFKNLLSFDGGGSTGSGARAGGLDGRGGFMAMLHPQEQVIDRSKGQRGGGGIVVNLNQSFAPGTDRRTILQAAAEAQLALDRGARNL